MAIAVTESANLMVFAAISFSRKKVNFELSEHALLGRTNAENIDKKDGKGNYFKKYYAFCRIF